MKEARDFIDKTSPLLRLQEELKTGVEEGTSRLGASENEVAADLYDYFENPSRLNEVLALGGLYYEHAFLKRHEASEWIDVTLRLMLQEFRNARESDAVSCFQTWCSMMEAVDNGIKNVSLVGHLQPELERLGIELSTKSVIRDIGEILEGSIQPFARLRLSMLEIAGKRLDSVRPIAEKSFGEVINELASIRPIGNIYSPGPFYILVNQWRNIANHNSYTISGGNIVCTYGSVGRTQQIFCTFEQLIEIARQIDTLGFLHKVAFEIFSIDNLRELLPYVPRVEITEYSRDAVLVRGLTQAGFSIIKAGCVQREWTLVLAEHTQRSRSEIEAALHSATMPYAKLTGGIKVDASVATRGSRLLFSFRASPDG